MSEPMEIAAISEPDIHSEEIPSSENNLEEKPPDIANLENSDIPSAPDSTELGEPKNSEIPPAAEDLDAQPTAEISDIQQISENSEMDSTAAVYSEIQPPSGNAETVAEENSLHPKRRQRQPPPVGPTRRSTRLQTTKEQPSEDSVSNASTPASTPVSEPRKRSRKSSTGDATPQSVKKKPSTNEPTTPRRLFGIPPFSASGTNSAPSSFTVSSSKMESESSVQSEEKPTATGQTDGISTAAVEPSSTTESQLRRSKRQSSFRDTDGSMEKKSKYPEGEWVSNIGRTRRVKSNSMETSATPEITPKRRGRPKKQELDISQTVNSAVESVINRLAEAKAPNNMSDDDDDIPLAQIASEKKISETESSISPSVALAIEEATSTAIGIDRDGASAKVDDQQKRPSNSSLFCADSDKSEDFAMEAEEAEAPRIEDSSDEDARRPLAAFKIVQSQPPPADENVQYPCTICRRPSVVTDLIRCQNCPRYFHHECVEKNRENGASNQDPARRRFCPKCVRSGPAPTPSLLSTKRKKIKSKEPSSLIVKLRRQSSSVGHLPKNCPGCGKERSDAKKKRNSGEDYSIYCNVECVLKTARKVQRSMRGKEEERVLVMDTTTGNTVKKRLSPNARTFSAWLRKHQKCYPVLPTSTSDQKRSTPSPSGSMSSTSKEGAGRAITPRTSASAALVEDEFKKIGADHLKITKGVSAAEHPSAVDPNRLNVRKALRDVLLLRAKEADDILLTNDEIKQFAVDLEQEVHKAHKDEVSYEQQCRNVIANLRNPSNKGLFRRLLNGELSTRRAATLSATEMSSTKYSYWAAAAEQERVEEMEKLKSVYLEKSKLFSRTKVVTEADSTCDIFGLLHVDTTNEHKSHLFSQNCKICTGKQKEDDTPASLVRRERKDSSLSRTNMTLTVRPELGEKLIKREDGKMDIVYPVPNRKSDPLHLESNTSSAAAVTSEANYENATSPAAVASRITVSKTSTETGGGRISITTTKEETTSISGSVSVDSPTPTAASSDSNLTPISAPASTSTRPGPPCSSVPSFWHGLLNMKSWYSFETSFKPVSGPVHLLKRDLPSRLEIVGRIPPDVAYKYMNDIRVTGCKDIIIFRLPEPPSIDHQRQWEALFQDMVKRQRFCVIEIKQSPAIKDFYLLPLPVNEEPNEALLPLQDGPGLENPRKNTILGVIVRHRPQDLVPKKKVTDESPISITSPPETTPNDAKRQEEHAVKANTPASEPDYMKIIQFRQALSSQDSGSQLEESGSVSTTPSTPGIPSIMQPKLKQLVEEIGHLQSPTQLTKILNYFNNLPPTSPAAPGSSQAEVKMDATKILNDPRQKASVATASTSKEDKPASTTLSENDQDEADKRNATEWVNWMQSLISKNVQESSSAAVGPSKPASAEGISKQDIPIAQSNWQSMVPRPPAPMAGGHPPLPPPGFTAPPPMMVRPGFGMPFGAPPYAVPPPSFPADMASRPPPGSSAVPPYRSGYGPPPVPPPTHQFSVPPPPYLLAAPPPPPAVPAVTSQSIVKKPTEEGEVSTSEEEVEDEDDERWPSRKSKKKNREKWKNKRGGYAKSGRPSWSRWDRTQPTDRNPYKQPTSSTTVSSTYSADMDNGASSGMYAQLNPVPESNSQDPNTAPPPSSSSSNASGVILKQVFYGPRRNQAGSRYSGNNDRRRSWK